MKIIDFYSFSFAGETKVILYSPNDIKRLSQEEPKKKRLP